MLVLTKTCWYTVCDTMKTHSQANVHLQRIAGNCQLANMTTPTAEAPEGYCQTTCDRCLATTAPVSAPTAAPTVVPQPPPAPVVFSPPPPPPPAATPSPTSAGTPPQSVTQPPPAPVTFSPPPPPPSPTSPNLQVCNARICYLINVASLYHEQSMAYAALVCWMLLLLPYLLMA